jgi:hypothetical protein
VTWLTFRQYRAEFLLGVPFLAGALVFLIVTGLDIRHALNAAGLNACLGEAIVTDTCAASAADVLAGYAWIAPVTGFLHFVPVIIGILLAAPILLDLEQRTYRLAWTQSITGDKWMITKLGLGLLVAALVSAIIVLLITWWRVPVDAAQGQHPDGFNVEGPVFASYSVFSLALAVTVGVFTKRLLPSVIATLIGVMAIRIFVEAFLRPRYLSPLELLVPVDFSAGKTAGISLHRGDWLLSGRLVDSSGSEVPRFCGPEGCPVGLFNSFLYHPADRFWLFQGIESLIFVGMAVVLLAAAVWWVRYRLT